MTRKKQFYYDSVFNELNPKDDSIYLHYLKIRQMVRNYDRKENQNRLLDKICNLKRMFDHDYRGLTNLPDVMLFYREDKVKSCQIEFLKEHLGMQC